MKGLTILDQVKWHEGWSSEIGRKLKVVDSSDGLFIFAPECSDQDIASVLKDVPDNLYQMFETEEAPREDCDFMGDSGRCYRKVQ